jgi:hypothetical protein
MNITVVSGLKMTRAGRRAMASLGSILSSESQLSSAAALVLITSLKQTLVTKCFEVGQNLKPLHFWRMLIMEGSGSFCEDNKVAASSTILAYSVS